jgi:hypothetical protein
VAHARKQLHAVVEADDAIITRIWHDIPGVHHKRTRRGDSTTEAAKALDAKTAWVARIAVRPGLEAAEAIVVSLTAFVATHVATQSFVT